MEKLQPSCTVGNINGAGPVDGAWQLGKTFKWNYQQFYSSGHTQKSWKQRIEQICAPVVRVA